MFPEVVHWLAPIFVVPKLFLSTFLILRSMLLRVSIQKINTSRTSIFRVTGGTYFWQFSFFDGAEEGVYFKPDSTETLAPKFSHHRLTCFEFADGLNPLSKLISDGSVPNADYSAVPNILERTDLEIYYQKVSKAFATIPDTSGDPSTDQIQARVEENRIVGPISDDAESFRSQEMVRQQRRSLLTSLITPGTMDFPLVLTLTLVELLDLLDRNPNLMHQFTTDLSQSHPHLVTSLLTKCNLNQQVTQSDQTSL